MNRLKDFVSQSGVVFIDETCSDSEEDGFFPMEPKVGVHVRDTSVSELKQLIRLIHPIPIDSRNGGHFISQIYWGTRKKILSVKLEGLSAIHLENFVVIESFVYLELRFEPREARPYSDTVIFMTEGMKPIRIDVIGVGYDPRNPHMPMRMSKPYSLPNILSKCNFEPPEINGNQLTILSNRESSFSLNFTFGPVPAMLSLHPRSGEIGPLSSVKVNVNMRDAIQDSMGYLLVPCCISFRVKLPSLDHESMKKNEPEYAEDEILARHSDKPVMQSISRVICNKGSLVRQSVCERSTRSRDAKLSLESRIKMFEEIQPPPDHYIGLFIMLGTDA